MTVKRPHWSSYLMVAIGVLGFLGGLMVPTLRWAFTVERRLYDIETRDRYVHGAFAVPTKEIKE